MVMPMVGRPPQHTFLCGCHCEERQEKLEYPAGLIRAMGKVAVISSRDGKHSQIITADSQHDPFPSYPGLKGPEAHQMDAQKWNDVPMLTKTLPEAGNGGTVGMMGIFIHAEIVALLVQTTSAHNKWPLVVTILGRNTLRQSGFCGSNRTGDSRDRFAQHKRAPPSTVMRKGVPLCVGPQGEVASQDVH